MKKVFEAPRADIFVVSTTDIMTGSPAQNPDAAYENQIALWDMNIDIQSY